MRHPVSDIAVAAYARFLGPDATLEESREGFDRIGADPPARVAVTETEVGGVPGRWVEPPESGAATILHLHAGGYIMGSSYSHRALGAWYAEAAESRVLLLDYRLAPEHPYPAALDDALAAFRALVADGVDPAKLVVSGDSAGGGLALATVLALRDAGDPLPAGVVTMSPFADLSLSGDSMQARAALDPLVAEEVLGQCVAAYLQGGEDPTDPRVSPVFGDYTGFPPMLMQVGTSEVLQDDTLRIAEKARAVGVDITLQVGYQMVHIYQMFADQDEVPEARRDLAVAGRFVRSVAGAVVA
ncbi:MAG TPA: alpha/beta hydrolase [Baekduia sp.]